MIILKYCLPDITFLIKTTSENYKIVKNKIEESIIKYNCENSKTIEINYSVNKELFGKLKKMIIR